MNHDGPQESAKAITGVVRHTLDEAFSKSNVDVLDEVLADGFVAHAPAEPGHGPETQDCERLKEEIRRNREVFPDLEPPGE